MSSRAWVQVSSTLLYRSWSVMIPREYSFICLRTSFSASPITLSLLGAVFKSPAPKDMPLVVASWKPVSFMLSNRWIVAPRPSIR